MSSEIENNRKSSRMSTSLKISAIVAITLMLLFLACMTVHSEPEDDEYYDRDNDPDDKDDKDKDNDDEDYDYDYDDDDMSTAAELEMDRLEEALRKLNITEKTTIHDLMPEISQELSSIPPDVMKAVYASDFIGQEINIFKLPIMESCKEFFKTLWTEPDERQFLDMSDYQKRAKAFVDSVKEIATIVHKSMRKPASQRSKVGLTPQSALTKEEFRGMLGYRRPPSPKNNR